MSRAGLAAVALAALLVAGDGCTKSAACRAGTLFVTVTLDATAAGADTLEVTVAVAGGQTFSGSAPRGSAAAQGTIEIDFPANAYPSGQSVTISVAAQQGGMLLGSGSSVIASLAPGCATASVSVQADGGDMAGADLSGADMTVPRLFSLRAGKTYSIGSNSSIPYSIALGDLNGDGKNDVAVSNSKAGVDVFFNNGDGTFGSAMYYQAGQHPQCVAIGDLNGDRKNDVVIADSQQAHGVIWVFFNNGNGTLNTNPVSYVVGDQPGNDGSQCVAIADFDSNGKQDIAVAAANGINVLLNQGNGTFPTTPAVLAAGMSPAGVVVADLDNDGKPDLAVANKASANVSVFLNMGNGTGTFKPVVNYGVGSSPLNLDAGDVTGDGRPDLVVGNSDMKGGMTVLVNKGDGSGTFPTSFLVDAGNNNLWGVAIGDLDGDTKNDLVAVNNDNGVVYLYRNLGGNTFEAPRRYDAGDFAIEVQLGDLGNGHLDIVSANGGGADFSVLLNDGKANLTAAPCVLASDGPTQVASADVNRDGNPDIIAADNGPLGATMNGNAVVLLGKGDGTFQPAVLYGAGFQPIGVVSADLNADGWPDVALLNAGGQQGMGMVAGTVSVLLNKKDGTFNVAVPYTPGMGPTAIAIGDLGGDPMPDLAVANGASNNVSVLINNGAGAFSATNVTAGTGPSGVAIADVSGDQKNDIVVANAGSGNVSVLINNGAGAFPTITNFAAGMTPGFVTLADLNSDGLADIIVRDNGLANVDVLLNKGGGMFDVAMAFPVDAGATGSAVAAADVDGDGKLDLVVTDGNHDLLSVLLGKGDGTFAAAITYAAGESPRGVLAVDLNKDGLLDVVVGNYAAGLVGGVGVFLNTTH